jgi:hypothetical protein
MDLKETNVNNVGWIHVDQNKSQWRALVNTVRHFGSTKCCELLEKLSNYQFLRKDSAPYVSVHYVWQRTRRVTAVVDTRLNYGPNIIFQHPVALGHHYSTKTQTIKVNDTLKRNTEKAAKKIGRK